ncbi:MAG: acylneuraminate cytidylyltransferase family protein [Dyadobacter sp.]|uniref:acylneuraminate cytidylyltransferase family protein n=1 Tax=Dyadobacter sp. TaxID=1914288 RepID=UPI003264BE9D
MTTVPKVLGIIPARGGSKAVPHKNMKHLEGRPLIWYTIVSALASCLLDTVMVSSDDSDTLNFVGLFPEIEIPFVRPTSLSSDQTPAFDVVHHAVEHYSKQGISFDYICLLQPTSPFRCKKLIDQCIQHVIDSKADSLVTVRRTPQQYNPYWAFEADQESQLSQVVKGAAIIPRRQDLPVTYYRDGSIYVIKTSLLQQGLLLGERMVGFENKNSPDINIDTQADWEVAEKLLANGEWI